VIDTYYTVEGLGQHWIQLKYNDTHTQIAVLYADYTGIYARVMYYYTTVSDFTLNNDTYFQNFLNFSFINLFAAGIPSVAKPAENGMMKLYANSNGIVLPGTQGRELDVNMFNALGQRIAGFSLDKSGSQTFLPKASNAYIFQMRDKDRQQSGTVQFVR
jgi:hypothetical protein